MLPILEEISKRFEAVNERAFELCERRGRKHGHEREDWFQAESERLGSLSAELTENDGALDE